MDKPINVVCMLFILVLGMLFWILSGIAAVMGFIVGIVTGVLVFEAMVGEQEFAEFKQHVESLKEEQ